MSLVKTRNRIKTKRNDLPDGDSLTPIAQWDVVPYQRIEQGTTFKIGIVAFSKEGIEKVAFSTTDGTNTEQETVTSMTLNDRTGVWEYWTTLTCATYTDSTNGVITLSATVTGDDGGTRVMDDLTLIADTAGDIAQPEAWVDTAGNDTTGTVGNSGLPYETIGAATAGLMAWNNANGNGNTTTGVIIRLEVGEHEWQDGGHLETFAAGEEWLTITAASGGTTSNTLIKYHTGGDVIRFGKCRIYSVGIKGGLGTNGVIRCGGNAGDVLWVDQCDITSSNAADSNTSTWYREGWDGVYQTGGTATGMYSPTARYASLLIRDCTIDDVGKTVFVSCPAVFNCLVSGVNKTGTDTHGNAVAWQEQDWDNFIHYNLRFTDVHNGGLSLGRVSEANNSNYTSRNCALVNIEVDLTDPYTGDGGGQFCLLWSGQCDHLLFWHVTFHRTGLMPGWTYIAKHGNDPGGEYSVIKNASFRGNNWLRCNDASSITWENLEVDNNHFVVDEGHVLVSLDANKTTGTADMDASGVPTAAGNLVDRITPSLVPVDANNDERGNSSDAGAYEYST